MPKDDKNIPFLNDGPLTPSEPQGFEPDQMVRCEKCLRANPPTRVDCLYCGAALTLSKKAADLRKPDLKPVDQGAHGYNNIFLPQPANGVAERVLNEAASLLKLGFTDLNRIIATGTALPLARTANLDEALQVDRRLKALGLNTVIVSDNDLAIRESPPVRVRALDIDEKGVTALPLAFENGMQIRWDQFVLLVTGRLLTKRMELKERKGRRNENEILEADQFFTDDLVMDLYCEQQAGNLRIRASGFDFSCLPQRSLTTGENFVLLVRLIRENLLAVEYDDSYNSVRKVLELVLPSEERTESRGWRREPLRKYSFEEVRETSNEAQFTRYSRLRYYLKTQSCKSY